MTFFIVSTKEYHFRIPGLDMVKWRVKTWVDHGPYSETNAKKNLWELYDSAYQFVVNLQNHILKLIGNVMVLEK